LLLANARAQSGEAAAPGCSTSIAQASKFTAIAGRDWIVEVAGPTCLLAAGPKLLIGFQKKGAASSLPPASKSLGTGTQARICL
jgi:hypothetical protein